MEDNRSISPATSSSSYEEASPYHLSFNPLWFIYTPLFNSNRSTTSIVRHNFRSIDELLSPSPTSHKNDDTGYNSQLLSTSLQSHESIDSQENVEEEDIKPSTLYITKTNETKNIKIKKNRTAFTDDQRMRLDHFYLTNRYPDPTQMEALSQLLSLNEKVIRVWFQNKRSREKNHSNSAITTNMWQQYSSPTDFLH